MARGTLAERAADQLRRRITLGDLRPGQELESMRALSRELAVSLPIVREAIAQLRGEGLVTVRHGIGVRVARRIRAARSVRANRRRASRRELTELRSTIEPVLAAAAAQRRTEHRLRELYLAISERQRAIMSGDPDGFTRCDLDVHAAVAKAAGNALGASVGVMAGLALQPSLTGTAPDLALNDHLTELHVRLADAIDARNARLAARTAARIAAIESGEHPP
jgi:DNA-binding FadR family transcriptional regulator